MRRLIALIASLLAPRARLLGLGLLAAAPAVAQTHDAFWLGMGIVSEEGEGKGDSLMALFGFSPSSFAESLTLSSFNGGPESGLVREGSSWDGNVTQHSDHITVGGSAGNENGWRSSSIFIDATGLGYLSVTAQLHAGHAASMLAIQFEDMELDSYVVSVATSLFSYDAPTRVFVALSEVPDEFDMTQIGSWSIGGGGLGTEAFQMSLYDMQLVAVPEPAEYAALLGLAVIAARLHRRRSCRSR